MHIMGGRIMILKDVHILILEVYEYVWIWVKVVDEIRITNH